MKYSVSILFGVFCIFLSINAQSLEEIKKLEAEKKFEAAGIMYHDLYMFSEAVNAFENRIDFIKKLRKPSQEALDLADSLLRRSKQAERMLLHCESICIVDSVIVDKESFLDVFILGEEAGSFFASGGTAIYENQLRDHRYYGKKDSTENFRLYSQTRTENDWEEERILDIPSEGEGSDNYPFVMPDGLTMYYASTRNFSIGGYDLFITRYNLDSDTYLAPSQMRMPFNSLYNDYLLVIDEENEIGYFVSDRFQPEDKVVVYAFIPNEEHISLPEDISDEERIDRAKITSVKDSWKSGLDYTNYLENIKENIEKQKQKKQRDFEFVINDNIVYYNLVDFESDAAKRLFLNWQNIQNEYNLLKSDLEENRKAYAKAGTASRRTLRDSILEQEEKLEKLGYQIQETAKSARNTEIKYLRQQQ
jgi:hypothetical protein